MREVYARGLALHAIAQCYLGRGKNQCRGGTTEKSSRTPIQWGDRAKSWIWHAGVVVAALVREFTAACRFTLKKDADRPKIAFQRRTDKMFGLSKSFLASP
jgi:hypothetical protein